MKYLLGLILLTGCAHEQPVTHIHTIVHYDLHTGVKECFIRKDGEAATKTPCDVVEPLSEITYSRSAEMIEK